MKNRLLIILLSLALAAGMTACAGKNEGPSKEKSGGTKSGQTESVSSQDAEEEEDAQDEAEEAGEQNDAGDSVQEEASLNEFFNAMNENLKEKITADDVAETGKGKYAVIFLLLLLSISEISGFLVADGSMIEAYAESFEKYNIIKNEELH